MCDAYNIKWMTKEDEQDLDEHPAVHEGDRQLYTASCWRQFRQLCWRNWTCRRRNPKETQGLLMLTVFFSLIMGLIYLQIENHQKGVMSTNSVLFLTLVQMAMQNIAPTITVFAADLPLYIREHKDGQYSMTTLFLSKLAVDQLPQMIIPVFYVVPLYFMIGLPREMGVFIKFTLVLLCSAGTAASTGYLLGCAARDATLANMMMPAVMMPNFLMSGFMINMDDLPVYMRPFKYANFMYWGFNAQAANVWASSKYDTIPCDDTDQVYCLFRNGDDVLHYLTVEKDDYWFDIYMLLVILVLFRVLAYIALRLRARKFQSVTA